MPGTPQTLPVPPPVSVPTLLNAIRLAASSGGSGGAAWGGITGILANQTDLQTALDAKVNGTGGGSIATGGFTLTVPATGTAALLGAANVFSTNGAASTPPIILSGTWFTGGSTTTTKPQFLIEPAGTTSTAWLTSGTGLGINSASGFTGRLIDAQVGGVSIFSVTAGGMLTIQTLSAFNVLASSFVGFFGSSLISAPSNGSFKFQNSSAANDFTLVGKASNVMQMGLDAAGVTNQMFTAASRITSDGVGANLTIAGGNGRGGAGGSLILSTYDTGAAGVAGTLRSRLVIDTAGAISFPVTTAVTAEVVVSDATWPVTINGVAYKICLKA